MNISIAIISILCFNGNIMKIHEEDQVILQADRGCWREDVQAQDHVSTATEDASWPWKIPLSKGKFALVDEPDFAWLSKHKWCIHPHGYAVRNIVLPCGKRTLEKMHRAIMGNPNGIVDHRNTMCHDNRRFNLRVTDKSGNGKNRGKQSNNSSGRKGVQWHKRAGKWMAMISSNGTREYLGLFDDLDEAYSAYCEAAKRLHGEFAHV